ncbi:alpha/beta fold hydrolase [Actinomarinicola tropica]|uniref:Alpha/beta fold hydrolase n=1 Tax=Actinomarinicola tropica TaxID=2789776 RepID=A0A5Q2REJ2_9ACTN|nr:alpha/beta hydrolase [Actinomarinicola tropica]QGG95338.1 alpha/beta fold hydrolase [Actinomarinicola tropica]
MSVARRAGRYGLAIHEHDADGSRPMLPPVVLVHGTMDRATSLAKVARRLPELRVVRYDRRGYGDSRLDPQGHPWPVPASVDEHVADLLDVLDGTPSVVVGHSMGGTIALAAAARHPDAVLAVGAFESPRPWVPWWPAASPGSRAVEDGEVDAATAAERFMRRMIGDARWERLPARSRATRRAEGPALVADMTTIRSPAYDDAAIRCPVVAGAGSGSGDHHARASEELVDQVRHGELVVVEGARHGAHLTHPDEFASFVRRAVDLAVAA